MATIANLAVSLSLQTQGFNNKIRGAQREARQMEKNLRPMKDAAFAAGKAFVAMGAAVTGSMAAAILHTANYGDTLAKTAQRTGLTVEALAGLQFQAGQAGTSFESVTKATKTLSNNILQAENGLTTYTRAFDQLGVDIHDTEGNLKQMDAILPEIANKFSQMEDGTVKAALAQQLLGRAGTELIPLLNDGAAGMAAAAKASRFGLVMSAEATQAAEEFNDRLDDLKQSMGGFANTVGQQLIPILTPLFTKLTDIIVAVKDWTAAHPGITKAVAGLGVALTGAGGLLLGLAGVLAILPQLGVAFTLLTGPIGWTVAAVGAVVAAIVIFRKEISSALLFALSRTVQAFSAFVGAAGDLAAAVGLQGLSGKLATMKDSLAATAINLDEMSNSFLASSSAAEELDSSQAGLNDTFGETNLNLETMAEMYARVEAEVNAANVLHAAEAELLQATVDKVGEFGRANATVSAETIGFLTTRNRTHEQVISDIKQREAAFMVGFIQRLEDGSKAEVGEYATRMIARTKAEKDFRVGLAADELRDIAARNTAAEAEYQKRFDSVKKTFKDVMLAGMRGDWEGFVKDIGNRIIGYFRDTVFVELLSDFGARFLTPLINSVQGALSGIFGGGASVASSAVGRGPATSFPGGGGLPGGGGGGGIGGVSSLASGFIGAAGGILGGIVGGLMDRKANGIISGGIDHIKNLLIHHLPDIEKELDFLPEIKDRLNDINDSAKSMVSLLRGLPTATNIGPEVVKTIVEDLPDAPGGLNLGGEILSRSGQDTTRSRVEQIFGGPSSRQLANQIFNSLDQEPESIDRSEGSVLGAIFGGGPARTNETRVVIELDGRVIAEALTSQVKNGGVELVASGTLA